MLGTNFRTAIQKNIPIWLLWLDADAIIINYQIPANKLLQVSLNDQLLTIFAQEQGIYTPSSTSPISSSKSSSSWDTVDLVMTLSLYRSSISNQAADAFNAGMFFLKVSSTSADLLHEMWYDWRFDQLIALQNNRPNNQHKYDQIEQGSMQHRVISGNTKNKLLMEATIHPDLRIRNDIGFGCQDNYDDNKLQYETLNSLLKKVSKNDFSTLSLIQSVPGHYPTTFPPWITMTNPDYQQHMPYIACTSLPLNRIRIFSQASINSFPSSWEWLSDRTRKYDWIAHPAGDAWKEERVQTYIETLQKLHSLSKEEYNNDKENNKDIYHPNKDVHDLLPHWMFWY